jgi:hypothetical protein
MIEHIVFFKFSPETTQAQKEEGIKRLKGLKDQLPGIVDLQAGFNFSERSKGYEVGLTVRFESKEDLLNYGPSDEHQAVVHFLEEIGNTDKLVIDFEL